jgi:hypothetical protein
MAFSVVDTFRKIESGDGVAFAYKTPEDVMLYYVHPAALGYTYLQTFPFNGHTTQKSMSVRAVIDNIAEIHKTHEKDEPVPITRELVEGRIRSDIAHGIMAAVA